jgi:DNA end-binding protein Ku
MRSMHTARLGFGLVSVNVKMYTATETHDAKFHLHHAGCLGSIRQKRVCEQCGAVVEYGDVVKGIQHGDKSYALFRQALSESEKVGIVRFAMRSKTHMGVVRVYGDNVLAIHTLMWSDEVRATDELKIGGKKVELSEKEVKMAHALIDSMAGEWKPTEYEDIYQQRVAEMIDAKADGAEFTTDKPDVDDDEGDVSDLLAKLEASIAAKKTAA